MTFENQCFSFWINHGQRTAQFRLCTVSQCAMSLYEQKMNDVSVRLLAFDQAFLSSMWGWRNLQS